MKVAIYSQYQKNKSQKSLKVLLNALAKTEEDVFIEASFFKKAKHIIQDQLNIHSFIRDKGLDTTVESDQLDELISDILEEFPDKVEAFKTYREVIQHGNEKEKAFAKEQIQELIK